MDHFHITGKVHDVLATLAGSGTVAVILSDVDLILKIVVSALTIIFLIIGIIARILDMRKKKKTSKINE